MLVFVLQYLEVCFTNIGSSCSKEGVLPHGIQRYASQKSKKNRHKKILAYSAIKIATIYSASHLKQL
jgi:hypothetical protein